MMPNSLAGKTVDYIDADGSEQIGTVHIDNGDQAVVVLTHDRNKVTVNRTNILNPKRPSFEIRGQVMTTSAEYQGEIGEITATGTGPKFGDQPGKRFFQIKYRGETEGKWFSEDQVFINDDDIPKRSPRVRML